MNKKNILAFFIVTILLSGCQLLPSKGSSNEILDVASIIYEGTEGLSVEFAKNSPPETTLRGDNRLPVVVILKNKGAAVVPAGEGWLSLTVEKPKLTAPLIKDSDLDFSEGYVTLPDTLESKKISEVGGVMAIPFDVGIGAVMTTGYGRAPAGYTPLPDSCGGTYTDSDGKTGTCIDKYVAFIEDPPGEKHHECYGACNLETGKIKASIIATICYNYKTSLSTSVCIDTEPYKEIEDAKTCEVSPIDLKNQGAPVAITRIEPVLSLQGDEVLPKFKVFVENAGSGVVIDKTKTKTGCDGTLSTDAEERTFNVVNINTATPASGEPYPLTLGNIRVSCTRDKITLVKDSAKNYFVCQPETAFPQGQGSFVTDFTLELEYGYIETKTRIVTIDETSA